MEISKLTVSENLKVQRLSSKEKYKKIMKLLRQAELDGRLAQAKSRRDLYRLAGYQVGRDKAGIAWAYVAIKKRGDVIEELDGFEEGSPVYRYRLSQGKTLKKEQSQPVKEQSKPQEEQCKPSEEQSKPLEEQSKPVEKSVKLVVGEVSLNFSLGEEALIGVIKEIFKR